MHEYKITNAACQHDTSNVHNYLHNDHASLERRQWTVLREARLHTCIDVPAFAGSRPATTATQTIEWNVFDLVTITGVDTTRGKIVECESENLGGTPARESKKGSRLPRHTDDITMEISDKDIANALTTLPFEKKTLKKPPTAKADPKTMPTRACCSTCKLTMAGVGSCLSGLHIRCQ